MGETHPGNVACLFNLAMVKAATDRVAEAIPLTQQAAALEDRLLGQVFASSSESQRLAFLQTLERNFSAFLTLFLHHARATPGALQAGLDLVLRRKAITAEVLAVQRDAVLGNRHPA